MAKNTSFWAKAALFTATVIWGFGFVAVKNSLGEVGAFTLLAMRFGAASVVLAIIFIKKLKKVDWAYIKRGFALATCLFLAYGFQTVGITMTTPGKNAFLTAVYCVLVPFFYWGFEKTKPASNHILAAFICLIGIGLVSLDSSFAMGMGDALTLACGVFYALHVIFVSRFTKESERGDAILLTILQFSFVTVFSLACALMFEKIPASMSMATASSILFLALPGTAIALLFQVLGQKYTHPALAAIIMSMEGIFGVGFSIAFGMEEITLRVVYGFVLILVAEIAAQLDFKPAEGIKKAAKRR